MRTKDKNGALRVWAFPLNAGYAAMCFALALLVSAAPGIQEGLWGASAVLAVVLCLAVWAACRKSLVRFTFTPDGFVRSGKYQRFVRWEEIRGMGCYHPGLNAGGLPDRIIVLMTESLPELELYQYKITRTIRPDAFYLGYRTEIMMMLTEYLPLDGWQKQGEKELYRREVC